MLGGPALFGFAVTASSPMTVLAGGIIATYAITGVTGVPLSFLLTGGALVLLTIGYVAMARHVPHAATAFALIAHGIGPAVGVGAAWVAVLSYNAIQISLYGLLGATVAALMGGSWAVWAGAGVALVGLLGLYRVRLSARLLTLTLTAEVVLIVVLDVLGLTHPAGGHLSLATLAPHHLFVNGVGGVFALSMAAFIGYESGPVFAEEARGAHTVSRATVTALVFLTLLYTVTAWALAASTGDSDVVNAARGGALPFSILAAQFGSPVITVATVLLITSIFASALSFHSTVARYLFALGRERLVASRMARIGTGLSRRAGAPVGGSIAQTVTAAAVVAGFALAHADPITTLFTWLSTLAAVGVLALLIGCSIAALRYFQRGGGSSESWTVRVAAPLLGVLAGAAILLTTVDNLASLLGVDPHSPLVGIVPAVLLVVFAAGGFHGLWLRQTRPQVYAQIGHGRGHPLAAPDTRLADVEV